jgi:hypothetical protein
LVARHPVNLACSVSPQEHGRKVTLVIALSLFVLLLFWSLFFVLTPWAFLLVILANRAVEVYCTWKRSGREVDPGDLGVMRLAYVVTMLAVWAGLDAWLKGW